MTPEQRLDFKVNFMLNDFNHSICDILSSDINGETRVNLEVLNYLVSKAHKLVKEQIGEELMGKAGYVYLIKTYDGFYKIGESKELRKRYKSITGPVEEIIHKIETDDCKRLERYLHDMHAAERRGQEIFQLSASQVSNICRINCAWYADKGLQHLSLF